MNRTKEPKKFDAIVCLSAIDWDFLWQRTQEIMSQFAAMGYPVLFIENTGVRIPGIKDGPRVWNRLKKVFSPVKGRSIESNANIEILSPFALPLPYMQTAVTINAALLRSKILLFSKLRNIPVNRILLWSYMTTPLAVELAGNLPWAGVVVDLVSDPCKVPGAEAIVTSHKRMLERANIVLCASVPTMNTAKHYMSESGHYKLHLFEDGFSTRLQDIIQCGEYEYQLPWEDNGRPLVAYIGGINDKIWWDAVSAMASRFPEINFTFIGPKEYNELPCEGFGKNVIWLPPFKEYSQLGYFLKKCKAGLIPYTPTPYVMEMRPAKINEYLVMGLPIVATKMPELERLSKETGPGIVYLADTADRFVTILGQAFDEDSVDLRSRRREIAKNRAWETICMGLKDRLQGLIREEHYTRE